MWPVTGFPGLGRNAVVTFENEPMEVDSSPGSKVKGATSLVSISCTKEPYGSLSRPLELRYSIPTKYVNICFVRNAKIVNTGWNIECKLIKMQQRAPIVVEDVEYESKPLIVDPGPASEKTKDIMISLMKSACLKTIKEFHHWMKPEMIKTLVTVLYGEEIKVLECYSGHEVLVCHRREWLFPNAHPCARHRRAHKRICGTINGYTVMADSAPRLSNAHSQHSVILRFSDDEHGPKTSSAKEFVDANASLASNEGLQITTATTHYIVGSSTFYMDTSVIMVIQGAIDETTALLEQKWDKIMYTGYGRVGHIIMGAVAKHRTPVLLELGGKCPVIVDTGWNIAYYKCNTSHGAIQTFTSAHSTETENNCLSIPMLKACVADSAGMLFDEMVENFCV